MNDLANGMADSRVFYRDIKPYDAPEFLDELHGPGEGQLHLPLNVYWGPAHTFELSNESDLVEAYQATLREGRLVDQSQLLNVGLLQRIWPELLLPMRVRELWEHRFPQLVGA